MRLSLYRGYVEVSVEDAADPPRLLQEVQLLALSGRSVDVEMKFAKESRGAYFSEYAPPMGPAAPAAGLRLTEEPKPPKPLEKAYYDTDLKAHEAVVELYRAGVEVSAVLRALAAGALGARRRRLLPTRWAITAVDKIVSDFLVEKIKEFR